jgi:hypothetical protein
MDEDLETIEIFNAVMINPSKLKPWHTLFYIECPQFLSFKLFDKYNVKPFFFRFKESNETKYIGVICCVRKKQIEDFMKCMYEMQKDMVICGYRDYEKFCRETIDEALGETDD